MNKRKICIITIVMFVMLSIVKIVNAAGMSVSVSSSEVTVGDSFSITISGIIGRVNVSATNVNLSTSGSIWVEGSTTISGTTKSVGTGTITVSIVDAVTSGADPQEVNGSKSVSVKIKQKEEATPPVSPAPVQPSQDQQNKTNTPTTTSKPKTTNNTKPVQEEVTVQEEKEEAKPQFGISSLILKGIKEHSENIEENMEVEISPTFDINTYEYTCNVSSDIKRVEILQDSGIYNENVIIENLEELKSGENIINIKLSRTGEQELTYTIKVIKEEEKIVETTANIEECAEDNKNEIIISMPLIPFILMQIIIIIVEIIIIKFIPWKKIRNKK